MNTSISLRTWGAVLGLALMGAGAAGCGEAAIGTDLEQAEAPLLFKDPSPSGLRLDVYDFNGEAAIAVEGPIGTEGRLADLPDTDSLEQLYRAIHPEASTVPAELSALSQRLAPKLAALRSMQRPERPAATFDKSLASFNSTVCKSFKVGNSKYTPIECPWKASTKGITIAHAPATILPGDRTYGWNAVNSPGKMHWISLDPAIAATANMSPMTWKWLSITGGNKAYWADIENTVAGELGLTHHSLSFIVH
jgi:hypothetical protein